MITLDEIIAIGETTLDGVTDTLTLSKTQNTAPSAIVLLLSSPQYGGTPFAPSSVTYGGNDMELVGDWAQFYFAPMLYVLKAPPKGPQDLVVNYPVAGVMKFPSYVAVSFYGANLGFVPTFRSHRVGEVPTEETRMVNVSRRSSSALIAHIYVQKWGADLPIGATDCIFEGDGAELGRWAEYSQYACLQLPSDGRGRMSYYVEGAVVPPDGDAKALPGGKDPLGGIELLAEHGEGDFVPGFDALMVEVTESGRLHSYKNIAVA